MNRRPFSLREHRNSSISGGSGTGSIGWYRDTQLYLFSGPLSKDPNITRSPKRPSKPWLSIALYKRPLQIYSMHSARYAYDRIHP